MRTTRRRGLASVRVAPVALAGALALGAWPAAARADGHPDPDTIVLNAVGDVAWPNGWSGIDQVDAKRERLFEQVKPILDTGDLNFANIECPLTEAKPIAKKTYPITCRPERLEYAIGGGFNLYSLANNHSLDAGQQGVDDTLALFEATNRPDRPLWWAGVGRTPEQAREPLIFTPPGKRVKVAFFALSSSGGSTSTIASMYAPGLHDRIAAARKQADIVIVSVHGGPEYEHVPPPSITKAYRGFIDAGATVVLGHHPHVVQGVERYGQGLIFYSLGNFSFGSKTKRHHETGARMYSMIGRVVFKKGAIVRAEIIPLYANNAEPWALGDERLDPVHCVPQVLKGRFAEAMLREMQDFTARVPGASPTTVRIVGEIGVIDLGPEAERVAKAMDGAGAGATTDADALPPVLW